MRVTTQGKRKIGDTLLERIDPRGEPYLWIGALREDTAPGEGTDLAAIAAGYVSVTPVHLDMTHHASLGRASRAAGRRSGSLTDPIDLARYCCRPATDLRRQST